MKHLITGCGTAAHALNLLQHSRSRRALGARGWGSDQVRYASSWLGITLALMAGIAHGGVLAIGQPTIENDQYVFPVVLRGDGEGVAALNFRFDYDPAVFSPMGTQSGAAATGANKQVTGNAPAPGQFVVVMMGVNRNTVTGGTVAQVVMRKVGEPLEGVSRVAINETTLSTFEGIELPSSGDSRAVRMGDGASPETEEEDEPAAPDDVEASPAPDTGRPSQGRATGVPMASAPMAATTAQGSEEDGQTGADAATEKAVGPPERVTEDESRQGREGAALRPLGVREGVGEGAIEPVSAGATAGAARPPVARVAEGMASEGGNAALDETENDRAVLEKQLPARRFRYTILIGSLMLVVMAYSVWRMRQKR